VSIGIVKNYVGQRHCRLPLFSIRYWIILELCIPDFFTRSSGL